MAAAELRVAIEDLFDPSEESRIWSNAMTPFWEGTIAGAFQKTADVLAIERSHEHRGLYHVLGGKLSPLDGIGPDQLRIKELIKRASSPEIKEIILALSSDTEGETTALYLIRVFNKNKIKIKITRLAYGLPVGGDIEFVDEVTLGKALEGRKEIT